MNLEGSLVEMRYSLPDPWTRKLFVALCRRYGVTPYRLSPQRAGTIMLRVPATFQQQTLWLEFLALSKELRAHIEDLTDRAIREAIHADVTEPAETGTKALPGEVTPPTRRSRSESSSDDLERKRSLAQAAHARG